MKAPSSLTLLAFALSAPSASAVTTLNTDATFDLTGTNWDNGTPTASDPGFISGNYSIGGNVNMSSVGTTSVTQTAGNGTGGQWNYHSNTNYTFNLNGGSISSTSGTFFVNGNTLNVGGGSITKTGGQFRLVSFASLTVSSGSITSNDFLVEGGSSMTIGGGTVNVTQFLNRGGTTTISGGTFTNTNAAIGFNRNSGSSNHTVNLTGGTAILSASNFLNNSGQITTIGGDFVLNGTSIVNLFNAGVHGNSSTINFTSDWVGSLTLDPGTAWADIFEAGDVSYDGTELGAGDFESYFQNNSGVITFIPEPSTALLGMLGAGFLLRRRQRA